MHRHLLHAQRTQSLEPAGIPDAIAVRLAFHHQRAALAVEGLVRSDRDGHSSPSASPGEATLGTSSCGIPLLARLASSRPAFVSS